MSQFDISKLPQGPKGFVHDLGSDQRVFKGVPWGKAMMWIFLLSDTFIFSCFQTISCPNRKLKDIIPIKKKFFLTFIKFLFFEAI